MVCVPGMAMENMDYFTNDEQCAGWESAVPGYYFAPVGAVTHEYVTATGYQCANYEEHAAPTGTTVDYYPTGLKSVGNECGESVSREDKVKEDIGEAAKSEKKNDKSKSVKDGAVNPREAVSVNGVDTDSTVSAVKKVEGVCRSPTKKLCCTEEQVDATKVDTVGPLENEKICVESVLNTLSEDAEMALTNRVGGGGVTGADRVLERETSEKLTGLSPDPESVAGPTKPHQRLFTSSELDALTSGESLGAGEEKEEYDKDLEDKLYNVDEVELKQRIQKNAELLEELTLEEMSVQLEIPVETLERTRESSPGVLSSPEYWTAWYQKTLATSEAARRANRDFREPRTDRLVAPVDARFN
ncbi:hypothetical protein PC128_g20910 [Phytophthora cactorum]|nr:hypothetical protein PC128_g20910 [Phytophthora cactorum]